MNPAPATFADRYPFAAAARLSRGRFLDFFNRKAVVNAPDLFEMARATVENHKAARKAR